MQALWDVLAFVAKSLVVFVTFAACVGFFFSRMRARRSGEPYVRLREVSARWKRNAHALKSALALPGKKRWEGASQRCRRWTRRRPPAACS